MLDREINPPDSYKVEQEEKDTIEKCACCFEFVSETYVLGTDTYGLKSDAMVCGYCLNELHNNLTLTN